MRYATVCSGIGAPELAIRREGLDWKQSFMSEIEKFPRAVLQHRFPEHKLHGDFTTIKRGDYADFNVLIGGTPCQDFSVAGKRLGLDAPRGNLALEYLTLGRRFGTRWLVWENVPGILSSWSDDEIVTTERYGEFCDGEPAYISQVRQRNDFATFLTYLGECGYGFAWRVLDGQHFGVPQRRRRIILVGYIGDWRPAAAVLFERESLRRDLTPRREKREGITGSLSARTKGGGGLGTDFDLDGGVVTTHTLRADGFDASEDGTGRGTPLVPEMPQGGAVPNLSYCLNAGAMKRIDAESETLIPTGGSFDAPAVAGTITADTHPGAYSGQDAYNDRLIPEAPLPPPLAFKIRGGCEGGGKGYLGQEDAAFTLSTVQEQNLLDSHRVRRLTPTECERLMDFEDGWTAINYNGKPAADGPRYKSLGNSMIVGKMRWVLGRLDQVDKIVGANNGQS